MVSIWHNNLFDQHHKTKNKKVKKDSHTRSSACRVSRPCYSEFCKMCRADRLHYDVKPRSEVLTLDYETGEVKVNSPRLDKNPRISARQQILQATTGYSNEELVAVTINLAIIPANKFDEKTLQQHRNKLKHVLKVRFSEHWFKGIIEDSYHIAKSVSMDDTDNRSWKKNMGDNDTVMKLHIHGIMPKCERTKEDIADQLKKTFKGSRQVRVQEIKSVKKNHFVETKGPAGFIEYAAKRELDFELGSGKKGQPSELEDNRKILTRKRQRFEYNIKSTKHHQNLSRSVVDLENYWWDYKASEDMEPRENEAQREGLKYASQQCDESVDNYGSDPLIDVEEFYPLLEHDDEQLRYSEFMHGYGQMEYPDSVYDI